MSKQTILSKRAFEKLIRDMVYLEEEHDLLLEYFDTASERARFGQFIEKYIAQVDTLFRNIQVSDTNENALPFVLVNSEVSLYPLDGSPATKVRIVFPLQNTEETDISCLSSVGMSMLLKELGDEVAVPSPSGSVRCRITSILLTGHD